MTRQTVYVPVAVEVEDGKAVRAYADYDGSPWMYSSEPSDAVWVEDDPDPDSVGEWQTNAVDGPYADAVNAAEEWLAECFYRNQA